MIEARDIKKFEKNLARGRALSRASYKCPVIKAANRALDNSEALDVINAVDLIKIELLLMPEAAATLALLERIKSYE